jgi:beta-glucanase (GH16 family)
VNNKLVWQLTDDSTSDFAPFPINGPTWQQLADIRDAAAKVAAEEVAAAKAKLDAEIAAAKAAADAKAAKAAAEVPKVSGLVIGKLLWSDDFDGQAGSQASSKSWTPRRCGHAASNGGGTCHNNEQQYYIPEAIAQDGSVNGNLIITTKRITQPPANAGICYVGLCSFTSGRLDTQGKLSFKYGFIESRIKMPAGSGNWPAFWMLGDNINQVGWPYSGEMDIVEIHSDRPSIVTSATHFSATDTPNKCCDNHRFVFDEVNFGRVDVSSDYHTYAIAWLPNSISYYFDGQLVSNTTPSRVSGKWVFNEKFFLILNNAVGSFGGSWANLQSSTMSIDWVRSYQLNGYGEVFTP